MKQAALRTFELALLAVALFLVVPPVPSNGETYPLLPGLAYATLAYAASLALAYLRKGENPWTVGAKLAGFLVFGWAIHLRCMFA